MVRTGIKLGNNLGAALKYQATVSKVSVMRYVGNLIYEDLQKKQPELMKNVSVAEVCVDK